MVSSIKTGDDLFEDSLCHHGKSWSSQFKQLISGESEGSKALLKDLIERSYSLSPVLLSALNPSVSLDGFRLP